MKCFLVALLWSASVLAAQTVPHFQLSVDGSYFRIHAGGGEAGEVAGIPDFVSDPHNLNFGLTGWDATLTENVNRWFGADLDVSGNYGLPVAPFLCSTATAATADRCLGDNPVHGSVNTRIHTFTFGPRFSFRKYGRIVPYAHFLLGVGHIDGTLDHSAVFAPLGVLLPQHFTESNTALAAAPGAGIDLNLSDRFGLRLFELDYFMTRFFNQRQDNVRVSAGINFQFGSK